MVKKPIGDFNLRNVKADDLINQTKGLKTVKERKRQEKQLIKKTRHNQKGRDATLILKFHTDKKQKLSDQIQHGFDIATKWKAMTYRELAEQLIMDGYFMPNFSWQQYEEDLRWDLHIDEEVLKQYAEEHNIILKEE